MSAYIFPLFPHSPSPLSSHVSIYALNVYDLKVNIVMTQNMVRQEHLRRTFWEFIGATLLITNYLPLVAFAQHLLCFRLHGSRDYVKRLGNRTL